MSKIDDKYAQLKAGGLDLGSDLHPGAPDMDAGYGGIYRQYQNGNIYYHPVMGDTAHEVHGGILSLYLKNGGPGVDPATGQRLFGFPLTDELTAGVERTPTSRFETGAIYWTHGTDGCVLTGAVYTFYYANIGINFVGTPLTSNIPVAGGEAIYCDRGLAWATNAVPSSGIFSNFQPPLLGNPLLFDPTVPSSGTGSGTAGLDPATRFGVAPATGFSVDPSAQGPPPLSIVDPILFQSVPRALYDALIKWRSTLFTDLWADRLSLIDSGARTTRIQLVPVIDSVLFTDPAAPVYLKCSLQLEPGGALRMNDRTLYDLELAVPRVEAFYAFSPHCLYSRKSWSDFGILHITDLHLSKRNEAWGAIFTAAGMTDTATNYTRTRKQFADFIKYANHLHSLKLADAVVATGDLVDFIIEDGDNPYSGNFARLRAMILGQPFDAGVEAADELLLPIFTTFGNHDHRLNPYDLDFRLNLTSSTLNFIGITLNVAELDNYSTFNLMKEEALVAMGTPKALLSDQHLVPTYDESELAKPYSFIQIAQENQLSYFTKYFGSRTYKVELGPHRLVMIDTGSDAGVPASASDADVAKALLEVLWNSAPDTKQLLDRGAPNSTAYTNEPQLIVEALAEAGSAGLVIVGVHSPPIAIKIGYEDFLRETEHPTAPAELTTNYVAGAARDPAGWSYNTAYFKTGDVVGSIDSGIASTNPLQFLQTCAGVGSSRPIDLLLCGHHHDRVEYRVRWDQANNWLEYYWDFYTDNPASYYNTTVFQKDTITSTTDPTAPPQNVYPSFTQHIAIDPQAPLNGTLKTVAGFVSNQNVTYDVLTVPPYRNPLNNSADPQAWWQEHRPLLIQTAALGPIDPRQRYDDGTVPQPTFQGFRLIVVRDNIIKRIRYIVGSELEAANFVMPWEGEDELPHPGWEPDETAQPPVGSRPAPEPELGSPLHAVMNLGETIQR